MTTRGSRPGTPGVGDRQGQDQTGVLDQHWAMIKAREIVSNSYPYTTTPIQIGPVEVQESLLPGAARSGI